MEQVKELFTDCTDVFEELIAVKTHLAEKIEECQSAVENIQSSLSKVDVSQAEVEGRIQVQQLQGLKHLESWRRSIKHLKQKRKRLYSSHSSVNMRTGNVFDCWLFYCLML